MSHLTWPIMPTDIIIQLVMQADWPRLLSTSPWNVIQAARRCDFNGAPGSMVVVPSADGGIESVLVGVKSAATLPAAFRRLATQLPRGLYTFANGSEHENPDLNAIQWAAGLYDYDRYRTERRDGTEQPQLSGISARAASISTSCTLARDLINTPANDMGPAALEKAARDLADKHGAHVRVVVGDELLTNNFPAVHAVGRAADISRSPRVVEITWGEIGERVVLIGKGVTFDTGGLDLKPSSGMRWMKKDMGGAAHALGLASMIMSASLPLALTVLLPIVENSVSAAAMRPGDVIKTRKGLSVEVGNTDAEGRLILADALTRAEELRPALTIDLATLTGAARVALGPEVTPFYTDDDQLADDLAAASRLEQDPLWRMPLWEGYESALQSDLADLKNDADDWAQAGSVTAALFLKRFAPTTSWAHFDIFAWNPRSRPGWARGAEAQAIRAIFSMLEKRYAA